MPLNLHDCKYSNPIRKTIEKLEPVEKQTATRKNVSEDEGLIYNEENWTVTKTRLLTTDHDYYNYNGTKYVHVSWPERQFTFFSQLPIEIRRQIWKFALPDPRIIEIRANGRSLSDTTINVYGDSTIDYDWSKRGPLSACYESREVFLEHYKQLEILSFDTGLMSPRFKAPITYIDFRRDTILFKPHILNIIDNLGAQMDLSLFQNVAVVGSWSEYTQPSHPFCSFLKESCPLLKVLSFVKQDPFYNGKEMRNLYLLDVAEDFKDINFNFLRKHASASQEVQNCYDTVLKLRRQFDEAVANDSGNWANIKIEFSLQGWRGGSRLYDYEELQLVPKQKHLLRPGVKYYTKKILYRESNWTVMIPEFHTFFRYRPKKIEYDGIRELF
ncbi:hypothetical protein B7494_g2698 [Chlorociboria aeruginascens]|nr:hypothetical protein B7494_g2698 [Chlorociboria aeruginascens]